MNKTEAKKVHNSLSLIYLEKDGYIKKIVTMQSSVNKSRKFHKIEEIGTNKPLENPLELCLLKMHVLLKNLCKFIKKSRRSRIIS